MKRTRQNTYVEREMRRRRIEKRYRLFSKVVDAMISVAVAVGMEALMFALFLMGG